MKFADVAALLAGQAGLLLGWRPDEFWAATPAELSGILSAAHGPANDTLDPQILAALMQQFPDAGAPVAVEIQKD